MAGSSSAGRPPTSTSDGPSADLADLLAVLLDRAPIGIAFLDPDLRYLRINEQLAAVNGVPAQEHLGRTVGEILPEVAGDVEPLLRSVLDTGLPLIDVEVETGPVPGEPGRRRFWLVSYYPIPSTNGAAPAVAGVGLIVTDVTGRRIAEAAAADAQRRMAFLAEASLRLSRSLAEDDVLDALISLLTVGARRLADWVVVLTPDGRGGLRPVRSVHADPELSGTAAAVLQTGPVPLGGDAMAARVHRTGTPVTVAQVGAEQLQDSPDGLPALIDALFCGPGALLPMTVRGRPAGVLSAIRRRGGPEFSDADLWLLTDLCRRAALALDNARLFGQHTRVAGVLQQALLPAALPALPGMALAARYRTADNAVDVGGDFYDVVPLTDDCWLVVIGDVSGRGVDAAGATGLARQTLRALAPEQRPADALRRLNEMLLIQAGPGSERFLTAAAGVLHSQPDGRYRLTLANGGHPPPLLLPEAGPARLLGDPGSLLGAFPDVELTETVHELHAGDTLLFYTDGVTESRGAAGLFGEERLLETVQACRAGAAGPGGLLDCLLGAVTAFRTEPGGDDTALLALTLTPAPAPADQPKNTSASA